MLPACALLGAALCRVPMQSADGSSHRRTADRRTAGVHRRSGVSLLVSSPRRTAMIALTHLALTAGKRTVLAGIDATFEAERSLCWVRTAPEKRRCCAVSRGCGTAHGSIRIDGVHVHSLPATQRVLRVAMVAARRSRVRRFDGSRKSSPPGRFPHHRWWEWNERPHDREAVARALDDVDLVDFAGRPIQTLSSGERQRAWIALGLAQETPVLLLDEPTSHLDVRAAHDVPSLVARAVRLRQNDRLRVARRQRSCGVCGSRRANR